MATNRLTATEFMDYFSKTLSSSADGQAFQQYLIRCFIESALDQKFSHLHGLDIDEAVFYSGDKEYGFSLTITLGQADRAAFAEMLSDIDRVAFYPTLVMDGKWFGLIIAGVVQGKPKLELRVKDGRVWLTPSLESYDVIIDTSRMAHGVIGSA